MKALDPAIALGMTDGYEDQLGTDQQSEAQHFAQYSWVSKAPAEAAFIVHLRKRWQADFTPHVEQEVGRILGTFTLVALALEDARLGGRGRANAIYLAPLEQIRQAYLDLPPEQRGLPLLFEDTQLHRNVPAVLSDIFMPKYQYVPISSK